MPSQPIHKTMPVRFSVVLATAFVVVLVALLAVFALIREQAYEERIARTHAATDSTLQAYEEAFLDIPLLSAAERQAMRRFLNPVHLEHARRYGVDRPSSRDEAKRLVAEEALEEIEPNARYDIAPMSYSVAAVTPTTRTLLDVIGARFHEHLTAAGLPAYRYQITSATRTMEDQNRLRRVNGNAAQTSAHVFGTTVDIHYARFQPPITGLQPPEDLDLIGEQYTDAIEQGAAELGQAYHSRLKAILGRVMLELQREGKLVVVYERRQPVYHLTVASDRIEAPPTAESSGDLAQAAP